VGNRNHTSQCVSDRLVIYPSELERQLGIARKTRWKWEKSRKIPPRDFFVQGEAVGWRPSTLEAAFSQPG
jgi:hypothetical protein